MNLKKSFLLASTVVLMGLTACDGSFLDQTVTTDLTEDVIYSDSAYAAGVLSEIYYYVGFDGDYTRFGNGGLQVACDEAEFKQSSSVSTGMAFATGTINPVIVTDDAWKRCYAEIRACNKFMSQIHKAPMAESAKTQYKTEARFLRSWYYYILVRHYGGVPLIGDTIYDATDEVNGVRNTYEECISYIKKECQEIINSKVLRARTSGKSCGRVSEAAVRALLSRMCLEAASPLHNNPDGQWGTEETKDLLGYKTYDKERWKEAVDWSRSIMTMSGDYRLYESNIDDDNVASPGWGFYCCLRPEDYVQSTSTSEGTFPFGAYQEMIFEQKRECGYSILQMFDATTCGGNGSGGYVYAGLADAFPMKDGKAVDDETGLYKFNPLDPNTNRDPRFYWSIIYNGRVKRNSTDPNYVVCTYKGDQATQDAVGKGTPTGFYIMKLINRQCAGNYAAAPPMGRILVRFAEILLNYAEAVNEYYGPSYTEQLGETEMSPYQALKLIRRRAGINAGTDGMYGLKANMTQEEMREAIRAERRIELAFEGFRFYDVRRWMIAEQTDNGPMYGYAVTRTGTSFSGEYFVVRNHVFTKKMYFFPLPYDETVKQPTLVQNPYYE